jgi:MFS family permease
MVRKYLQGVFELTSIRNVRIYLLLSFTQNLWFLEAVWFFYWARFASYTQIGVAFSILTLFWILMEVPTGVLADLFGRKFAIVLGFASLLVGGFFLLTGTKFWWLILGCVFENFGRASISGALDALVYDDLLSRKKASLFPGIISLKTQVSFFAYTVATITGGLAYTVNFRLPYLFMLIAAFSSFVISLQIVEKFVRDNPRIEWRKYIEWSKEGFRQLLNPRLRWFMFPAVLIMMLYFQYDWGFSKPAIAVQAGLFWQGQGFMYAFLGFLNVLMIGLLPKFRRIISDRKGIFLLCTICALGYLISSYSLVFLSVVSLILIDLSGYLADPWISIVINERIDSVSRATTLSTLQFIAKVPYSLINVLAGAALDGEGAKLFHFWLGLGAIILLIVWVVAIKKKNIMLVRC